VYRLVGPVGVWPGARPAIFAVADRVKCPLAAAANVFAKTGEGEGAEKMGVKKGQKKKKKGILDHLFR
jgi:hypothetical protein